MSKNKKRPNKGKLVFKFNRKDNIHSMETKGAYGEELLLAYQSLKEYIENKTGMPIEITEMFALEDQKAKTKEKGK